VAKGDGLPIGSAAMSSVLTIFLTVSAVYPATVSEANQPATTGKRGNKNETHVLYIF
jgi:hypothetical protein